MILATLKGLKVKEMGAKNIEVSGNAREGYGLNPTGVKHFKQHDVKVEHNMISNTAAITKGVK